MAITIPEAIITLDPESFIAFYDRLCIAKPHILKLLNALEA
jgi:hypothetical protein